MSALQANPFYKPSPFQLGHFEKFKHPYLSLPKSNEYSHLVYHESLHPKQTQINDNNWAFNQNNLSRKLDFARKYQSDHNQVSEFQVRMKMSSVYALPNQNQKSFEVKDGKLQNPFLRKNLIINKDEVANQVQMDLNLYKNKVNGVYQKVPRVSFGRDSMGINQSPALRPSKTSSSNRESIPTPQNIKISHYIEQNIDSKDRLSYSKTPQVTERILPPFREEDQNVPSEIKFRKKTFFLNYVNLN